MDRNISPIVIHDNNAILSIAGYGTAPNPIINRNQSFVPGFSGYSRRLRSDGHGP